MATSLAGDKNWGEDVDGRLVDQVANSEAPRSLRARWSGQNCRWMNEEGQRTKSEMHLVQKTLKFLKAVLQPFDVSRMSILRLE